MSGPRSAVSIPRRACQSRACIGNNWSKTWSHTSMGHPPGRRGPRTRYGRHPVVGPDLGVGTGDCVWTVERRQVHEVSHPERFRSLRLDLWSPQPVLGSRGQHLLGRPAPTVSRRSSVPRRTTPIPPRVPTWTTIARSSDGVPHPCTTLGRSTTSSGDRTPSCRSSGVDQTGRTEDRLRGPSARDTRRRE